MFPIFFHIGPITIHTYGVLVAIGFLLALRVARMQFDIQHLPDNLLDPLVFSLMIFGLVGARIAYFGVDHFNELRGDWMQFFRVWEGGLVLYGAVIAGIVVIAVYSKLYHTPFLALTDSMSAPLLLGQSIGRLGCFFAGCCYGRPTDSFFQVVFKNQESLAPLNVALHPTQIYEFIGDLALFVCAIVISRKGARKGTLTAFYLTAYGLFRFLMEYLRGDDRGINIGPLSPSQAVALCMILGGTVVYLYGKKRKETY